VHIFYIQENPQRLMRQVKRSVKEPPRCTDGTERYSCRNHPTLIHPTERCCVRVLAGICADAGVKVSYKKKQF